ncbi:MAG: helix-turn-helix transcriptional regulator [Oscillospiraceae bacterium]|nr:helix-turn-helix transcriptional regulator [Oscillospiraceae bacterium]
MKKQSIEHTQLLILSLLSSRDMYGYEMILELARRSQNVFEMKEGTLYPVLHALEKGHYVEAYEQEAPTGRVRKYYRLTKKGRGCLAEERGAWEKYAGAVNAVLRAEAT